MALLTISANSMFNPTLIVIEAVIRELRTMYERTYGLLEPDYPGTITFVAQLALENIATSDAAYHDVNHTIMVTLVGQEILRGRHISVGGVTPCDWLPQQQAKSWELRAAMSMARLWRDQGKPQQAREPLAPVYGCSTRSI
jgi:hypothetical protein